MHGQWNYRRVSMLILYFFYKCLAFSFCMWLFCLSNGFSGQKIFDDAYQTLYSVIFTSTPIMAFGIFERGLDAHVLLKYPRLYIESQRNRLFSWSRFFVFAGSGIGTAIIMYYMTMSSYFSGTHNAPNGYGLDIFLDVVARAARSKFIVQRARNLAKTGFDNTDAQAGDAGAKAVAQRERASHPAAWLRAQHVT